jgi:catechol 2,3-dioxygenase-like lactoylglutathione lyase family enzyme
MSSTEPSRPSSGAQITHLVLTVRDIEASHRFYTEIIGYQQCGLLEGELAESEMRFYRAGTNHHDLALVQVGRPDEVPGAAEDWLGFFPDQRSASTTSPSAIRRARRGCTSWTTCRPTGSRSTCAATTA